MDLRKLTWKTGVKGTVQNVYRKRKGLARKEYKRMQVQKDIKRDRKRQWLKSEVVKLIARLIYYEWGITWE